MLKYLHIWEKLLVKKKKKKRDEGEKTELEKNCIIPALGTVKHTFLITVPKSCYLKNM